MTHPTILKVLEDYWLKIKLDSRNKIYSDEELENLYDFIINSKSFYECSKVVKTIYEMHPYYIKKLSYPKSSNRMLYSIQLCNELINQVPTDLQIGILLYPIYTPYVNIMSYFGNLK